MSKAIVYLAMVLIVLSILAFLLGLTLGAVIWLLYVGAFILALMIAYALFSSDKG
jgi:4-hydroxybenzoate polyprenyltransferase